MVCKNYGLIAVACNKYLMRDLIDLIENHLDEGVGLANRRPGERFANPEGDELIFKDLSFYPKQGAYDSPEALNAAIGEVAAAMGTTPEMIHWANEPRGALAFGLAQFDNNGKMYYLGRYMKNISPNRAQNSFPNDLPGGFKYQSKVAKKEASGYKPSDILTQFQNNTPKTILAQVKAKFGNDSDEARATEIFMASSGENVEIPKGNMNPDAFSNYFCELLQPMALVMGKRVRGNAREAEQIFFKGSGYSTATISFNPGVSGELYDSLLVNPEGKQIKVSSKAKDGANASVINILKSVKELSETPAGKKLLTKYADTISILEIINDGKHIDGPLNLAVLFKMITPAEKEQVKSLARLGPEDDIIGAGILSPKLEKMYQGRKAKDPTKIIPIEHMLSAIAYPVADYVNKNTDFGKAASEILNNSALVQMYTTTRVKGDVIVLESFNAVYPSNVITGVLMKADKSYYSTGGKGNLVFKILKNGASDEETEVETDSVSPRVSAASDTTSDLDAVAQKRSGIKASSDNTLGNKQTLGRARRR
jgi:hypothetical protein